MIARRAGSPAAYAALGAVCIFWGTTYLGIRIAIETLPPAFVVCTRYILSGSILLAIALGRGAQLPRGRELWVACACGALILGIGNGSLVYAEVLVPSGLASLFITLAPFWMVGLEVLTGGERLRARSVVGMLIGFLGTVLLLLPGTEKGAVSRSTLVGFAILQIGVLGWTIGSLYQRRQPARAHPIVTGAVQQLAAGLLFIPIVLFVPAPAPVFSQRSVLAVLYLVVFGSIVGYSAYIFAMDRLPVAVASVYPYINSIVAVFLGWLFFREPFGWRELAAMAIIFAGVAVVKTQASDPRPDLNNDPANDRI
jgi:drug/metabolite transporter (DMT)-like permease